MTNHAKEVFEKELMKIAKDIATEDGEDEENDDEKDKREFAYSREETIQAIAKILTKSEGKDTILTTAKKIWNQIAFFVNAVGVDFSECQIDIKDAESEAPKSRRQLPKDKRLAEESKKQEESPEEQEEEKPVEFKPVNPEDIAPKFNIGERVVMMRSTYTGICAQVEQVQKFGENAAYFCRPSDSVMTDENAEWFKEEELMKIPSPENVGVKSVFKVLGGDYHLFKKDSLCSLIMSKSTTASGKKIVIYFCEGETVNGETVKQTIRPEDLELVFLRI